MKYNDFRGLGKEEVSAHQCVEVLPSAAPATPPGNRLVQFYVRPALLLGMVHGPVWNRIPQDPDFCNSLKRKLHCGLKPCLDYVLKIELGSSIIILPIKVKGHKGR